MRIISGKYRGIVLDSPKNNAVRPTTDRIKETIFNIIQWDVNDARVLDLFAGSGALGIEALSRGAKEVIFVDNNANSLRLVNSNLAKIKENCSVFRNDYLDALRKVDGKFDLIFVDAPYMSGNGESAVDEIIKLDLLSDGGKVVYEHSTEMPYKGDIPENYNQRLKKMGTVCVDFLEKTK